MTTYVVILLLWVTIPSKAVWVWDWLSQVSEAGQGIPEHPHHTMNPISKSSFLYVQTKWLGVGAVMPDVRIPKREERRPPRQCNSQKGKFIADSSQGSCRIQHSGAGSGSPEPELLHKFIGWAHAVGSWFKRIGYKFAKQFHWSNTLKTFTHLGLSWGFPPRS